MQPLRRLAAATALFYLLLVGAAGASDPGTSTPEGTARLVLSALSQVRSQAAAAPSEARLVGAAVEALERELRIEAGGAGDAGQLAALLRRVGSDRLDLLDRGALARIAIDGILAELGDPYAALLEPDRLASFLGELKGGEHEGVGLRIVRDDRGTQDMIVLEAVPGSPAAKAGVRPGDVLLGVGTAEVAPLATDEVRHLLRGAPGTAVDLRLARAGKAWTERLVREEVHVPTVEWHLAPAGPSRVGYIQIRRFGPETGDLFRRALQDLRPLGLSGLVIDLRGNGGGYVHAAGEVCSQFLPEGATVARLQRRGESEVVVRSKGATVSLGLRPIVLIDSQSASASEIVAAALQEHQAGTVVGTTSYGKGSIQRIYRLGDSSGLRLTVGGYRTPSGRGLENVGVRPDLEVAMPMALLGTAEDVQLARALEAAGTAGTAVTKGGRSSERPRPSESGSR